MVEEMWNRAKTALHRGEWKLALVQLRKRERFSAESEDYFKLLCCAFMQAGRWDEVANIAASAYQRYPEEALFLECWSWAEHTDGQTAGGLEILRRHTSRFGNRESFNYMLACLYSALNERGKATRYLEKAKRLASDQRSFLLKASHQRELRGLFAPDILAFSQ